MPEPLSAHIRKGNRMDTLISHEQDCAMQLLNAMRAAHDSLSAQGQRGSASCVEKAMDELDTASAAEIARMFERNRQNRGQ